MIILVAGGKWIGRGKSTDRGGSWGAVTAIQQGMIIALCKGDRENEKSWRAIWEVQFYNPWDLLRPNFFRI